MMALSGRYFNVGVFEIEPRMHLSTNAAGALEATGLVGDILNIMAKYLDFSITFVETERNKYGKSIGNGSWNGLIGNVFRKEVDFDGIGLLPDSERIDYFDYPTLPLFRSYMAVAVRQPAEKELDLTTYLKPFSFNIWIIILLMCCLTWFLNFYNAKIFRKFSAEFSVAKILLPIYICFTILMACYNSLLIASVTVGDKFQYYDTLDDLVQEGFYYGVQTSGFYYSHIKNTKSYPYQEIIGRIDTNDLNPDDTLKRCLNEKFAIIGNSVSVYKRIEWYCTLDIIATKYFPSGNYITLSKHSYLTEIFSVLLASTGVLHKISEQYIRKSRPHCDISKYRSKTIQFSHVLMPYVVLGIGIIFSLTVCLIELKINKILLSKK